MNDKDKRITELKDENARYKAALECAKGQRNSLVFDYLCELCGIGDECDFKDVGDNKCTREYNAEIQAILDKE